MQVFLVLAPVFAFFVVMLAVGFVVRKKSEKERSVNFSKDYYIGGRSLGGFVLAMTLVATYSSGSSFVGGPGVAWQRGFGWVYLAMTQVLAAFLVMGVMGKKMAVISRKIDAITVIDVIRTRYESNLLASLGALLIVVFFCGTIVAQFISGANLFAAAAGVDYTFGLLLFALVVVTFTAVGGFKGVAITDLICALAMLLGLGVLLYAVLHHGGGMSNIMATLSEQPQMLEPLSGGAISVQLLVSFRMLSGVSTLGLPQSLVRNMSYKNSRSLHRGMIYGTIVVGAMMLGMHFIGVLARGLVSELPAGGTTDSLMPHLVVNYLPPVLAGIAIIAPLAAAISTVSSLLIAASSSIIKDVYQHAVERKGGRADQKKVGLFSIVATAIIGLICIGVSLKPPTIIIWINMFSFGGLQTAFFWTFLLGFFWKKANTAGAFLSMAGGVFAYCYFMAAKIPPIPLYGFHQIVVGVGLGFFLFVAGSLLGKPNSETVLKLFFPEHYPEGTKIEVPTQI
ncbi:MAG: sodium/pantothenate symporter [Synergistaceae bacterium]|jgi:sodium/pantothenate symporter|nr:sodium/pantothenate symporter [Synergistaceae bacterium]